MTKKELVKIIRGYVNNALSNVDDDDVCEETSNAFENRFDFWHQYTDKDGQIIRVGITIQKENPKPATTYGSYGSYFKTI